MADGISFDEFSPEDCGGFDRVAAGSYHMQVVDVDPEGKKGALVVGFEVLAGTTPNQEGKVHTERFSADLKKIPQKKRAALALATGIVTMDMAKKAKADKQTLVPDWMAMVGKQVCMNMVDSDDGKYVNLNWDEVWGPADKKASHVPLHAAMLKRAGIVLPADRPIGGTIKSAPPSLAMPPAEPKKTETPAQAVDGLLAGVV